VTKRVAAALAALALFLVAGWWLFLGRVPLLTGSGTCYVNEAHGLLVVDLTYGTAIIDNMVRSEIPEPVAWPAGYTGRRVGSEVEVLNRQGNVVAVTGREVTLPGGGGTADIFGSFPRLPPSSAFMVCDVGGWSIPEAVLLPLALLGLISTIVVLRVVLDRRSRDWPAAAQADAR
jgi:hypothetical protein